MERDHARVVDTLNGLPGDAVLRDDLGEFRDEVLVGPGSESCQANLRSSIGSTRWTWLRNLGHCVTSLHSAQVMATGALTSMVSTSEEDMSDRHSVGYVDNFALSYPACRLSTELGLPDGPGHAAGRAEHTGPVPPSRLTASGGPAPACRVRPGSPHNRPCRAGGPLSVPDQPGRAGHTHDSRQTVLPGNDRAVRHRAADLRTSPAIPTNSGDQLGSVNG